MLCNIQHAGVPCVLVLHVWKYQLQLGAKYLLTRSYKNNRIYPTDFKNNQGLVQGQVIVEKELENDLLTAHGKYAATS